MLSEMFFLRDLLADTMCNGKKNVLVTEAWTGTDPDVVLQELIHYLAALLQATTRRQTPSVSHFINKNMHNTLC